jgi:hypothetical protein
MADLSEALLALRYAGIRQLPDAGDAGDRRLELALEREMASKPSRRRGWTKRRIKIGGFAVPPVAMLAVVATAAAATTAAVATLSAINVFQNDPQGLNFNGNIETVLPSTVRQLATVSIPDYGQVAVWGATTKPGGFCFALKLPDGAWGGLHISQDAQDGWDGGSIPGCFQTRQQQILLQTPLKPGQQPSGTTGQELMPTPLEVWENEVENSDGHRYALYIGYVEAQGTATTVRDPDTGATTQVMPDGYYVLSEPSSRDCGGCDAGDLQVLDAAGQPLKPDYTWGGMLPGYSVGPSQR